MNSFVIVALLSVVFYFFINLFAIAIIDYKLDGEWWEVLSPKYLYYNTKLNMFGCIVVSTLFNILSGIFAIAFWVQYICFYLLKGIKYIFTVGKKPMNGGGIDEL